MIIRKYITENIYYNMIHTEKLTYKKAYSGNINYNTSRKSR